ncbi:MAG: hypothetical protein ABIS50_00135 [Luteolibacter sp.]|uniref:hypothetical protein n=1 Tax=Luteolibacter sp. TaxID=1962973 RepID=UPI003264536F
MTKKSPSVLIAGLCVAGSLVGFTAKRLTTSDSVSQSTAAASRSEQYRPDASGKSVDEPGRTAAKPKQITFPARHSTDTLETLALVDDSELYARLALWLGDASAADIAAYWSIYSKKPKRSNDITDLVFLNWTRLDPQAAIAGSSSDQHAWWAWACHDPKGALAFATANAPDHINHVAWGIGEFHPDWLRQHFKELSKGAQDNALRGMAKWDDGQDPLDAMKFLKEVGRSITPGTFKALVRKDPWAALDWVKENPNSRSAFGYSIDDPMKFLVRTMADERPEDLERLAAQTPSGSLKLQMDSALFANLLKTDPEAAMEQAKSTTAPRIAAERYAAIGLTLAKSNPEQAFEIAKSLFAACPDAMQMMAMIEYPNGGSGSGMTIPGVTEFVETLVNKDPARALQMTIGLKSGPYGNSAFSTISGQWAERDFVGYTNWVNQQTDSAAREGGVSFVINKLQEEGNYAESADWVMTIKDDEQSYRLSDMLSNWQRKDPAAAADWLENVDLPEVRKTELRTRMQKNQ